METLFIVSAAAIIAMIAIRLLEMRFERMMGLSHASTFAERVLRPHVKRFEKALIRHKKRTLVMVSDIPKDLRRHGEHARDVAVKYIDEMRALFRGKRMLTRGSVSFFLLNIADYDGVWKKKPELKETGRVDEVEQ